MRIIVNYLRMNNFELIAPVNENFDQENYFNKLSGFPALDELRKIAWPKLLKPLQPQ